MLKIKSIVLVGLLGCSVSGMAAVGSAGCGLGSIILGSSKGIGQLLAATTNNSTGSQTFGITSGTSNCGSSIFAANERLEQYLEANRIAFASEVARGSGESVLAVSNILQCKDSAAVGHLLKVNYSNIFTQADQPSAQSSASIIQVLRQDSSAAAHCQNLG